MVVDVSVHDFLHLASSIYECVDSNVVTAFGRLSISNNDINGVYVDGVSITYGSSPACKHIWTYANGVDFRSNPPSIYVCPCNNVSNPQVPSYVGSDYYCETDSNQYMCCDLIQQSDDPLCNGQQCIGPEAPCCTNPNLPWFLKTLSETTTEDIELRVCADENVANDDTPLQVIELFVY